MAFVNINCIICKMISTRITYSSISGKDLFAFNLKYLMFVGLWPNDNWSKKHIILYKTYEVIVHFLAFYFMFISGIGTYQYRKDTIKFLTNVDKSIAAYNFVSKVIFFVAKRKQLKVLIKEITESGDKISEERNKLMTAQVVVITALVAIITGAFALLSLIGKEVTIEAWMPFDPTKDKLNLALGTQIILICFIVPVTYRGVAMQGIVCSIVMYLCDQLRELKSRLIVLEYSPENEKYMRNEFKEIIKKHVRLMGYSKSMTNVFKEYFLIQNLVVTVELCLNALMVATIGLEQKKLIASFMAFLGLALLNAYIYCYLGNELIIQSEGIATAAYEAPWTSWPVDIQKSLLTVITVAQRPFKLSAGGFTVMSIQTYGQTLYNGYSIFAVLNDAVD